MIDAMGSLVFCPVQQEQFMLGEADPQGSYFDEAVWLCLEFAFSQSFSAACLHSPVSFGCKRRGVIEHDFSVPAAGSLTIRQVGC